MVIPNETKVLIEEILWVLVKGFNLRCHNKETILFHIDPLMVT